MVIIWEVTAPPVAREAREESVSLVPLKKGAVANESHTPSTLLAKRDPILSGTAYAPYLLLYLKLELGSREPPLLRTKDQTPPSPAPPPPPPAAPLSEL